MTGAAVDTSGKWAGEDSTSQDQLNLASLIREMQEKMPQMSPKERRLATTLLGVMVVALMVSACTPIEARTATPDSGYQNTPTWLAPALETLTPVLRSPTPSYEPTLVFTATPTPTPTLTATTTPAPTEICVIPLVPETNLIKDYGMTCEQLSVIRAEDYKLLYSHPGGQLDDMYPLGRIETTSAFGITWKFVSGFVVDTAPPGKNQQLPVGDYVYLKVRFLDKSGAGHDYFMQMNMLGSNKVVSAVQTDGLVIDPNKIIAAENKGYSGATFISKGIIKIKDQWIAQIPVEDVKHKGALRGMEKPEYKQILSELISALEGKGNFPEGIPGFFLPVECLIVRK